MNRSLVNADQPARLNQYDDPEVLEIQGKLLINDPLYTTMSESPSGTGIIIMFVGTLIMLYGALLMIASGVNDLIEVGILSENTLVELLYSATLGIQSFPLAIVLGGVGFGVAEVGEDML